MVEKDSREDGRWQKAADGRRVVLAHQSSDRGRSGVRKTSLRFRRRVRRWLFWTATVSNIVDPVITTWLILRGR